MGCEGSGESFFEKFNPASSVFDKDCSEEQKKAPEAEGKTGKNGKNGIVMPGLEITEPDKSEAAGKKRGLDMNQKGMSIEGVSNKEPDDLFGNSSPSGLLPGTKHQVQPGPDKHSTRFTVKGK